MTDHFFGPCLSTSLRRSSSSCRKNARLLRDAHVSDTRLRPSKCSGESSGGRLWVSRQDAKNRPFAGPRFRRTSWDQTSVPDSGILCLTQTETSVSTSQSPQAPTTTNDFQATRLGQLGELCFARPTLWTKHRFVDLVSVCVGSLVLRSSAGYNRHHTSPCCRRNPSNKRQGLGGRSGSKLSQEWLQRTKRQHLVHRNSYSRLVRSRCFRLFRE